MQMLLHSHIDMNREWGPYRWRARRFRSRRPRFHQIYAGNDLQAIADAMLHSVGHMPDYALLATPHMKIHSGFDGLNALLDAHETRERVDCIGSMPFLILYLPVFLAGHSRDFAEVASNMPVMVRRGRSFGEIDGPQRRRERFSVLVNCQGVKRMLVPWSAFPKIGQVCERQTERAHRVPDPQKFDIDGLRILNNFSPSAALD
jgi:hypothetical protein